MSRPENLMSEKEKKLLQACEKAEFQIIRELIESKAVKPNTIEKRHGRYCDGWQTYGWRPLHYACM